MKVLHIINSLETGGAERLVSGLLPALAARGIEVEACVLAAEPGPFGGNLIAGGVVVRTCGRGSFYSPSRISDVTKAIRESNPDLIHVHLAPALYWTVAALWLMGSRIPLVTTEHTTKTRRMSRTWLKPVERFLYRRCSGVICVSRSSAEAVGAWLGTEPAGFPVIANGIELERFRQARPARDVLDWLGTRTGIVMAARFTEAKDHATLIRALALLPDDFALVLAGDGATRGGAEKLAADLGLTIEPGLTTKAGPANGAAQIGRVLFAGARNDIPEVLAACRVSVQSSLWEGFGLSVVEAMASGLPVVASDVPGLAEIVGMGGLLFPPGDAEACAAAIRRVAVDSPVRDAAIQAGKACASRFSMATCAEAHADYYRRMLSTRAARQPAGSARIARSRPLGGSSESTGPKRRK